MDIAGNLSRRRIGRALHLERTNIAVELGGTITKHAAFVQGPSGMKQHLVVWGDRKRPFACPSSEKPGAEAAVIATGGIANWG